MLILGMTLFPTTSTTVSLYCFAASIPASKARNSAYIVSLLWSALIAAPYAVVFTFPRRADANPTNHFWRCLAESGLTPRLLHPSEGPKLPSFGLGSTNLVERPSAEVRARRISSPSWRR